MILIILLQIVLLAMFVIGGYLLRFYNLKPIKFAIISGTLSIVVLLFDYLCLDINNAPTQIIELFAYIAFQLALAGFIFAMFGIRHDSKRSALGNMSEKEIRIQSNQEHTERLYGIVTILCCLILMFFIGIVKAIIFGPWLDPIGLLPCVIYVTVLAIVSPIVIGIALKGYQFWNGLLSLVLLVVILFSAILTTIGYGFGTLLFYITVLCLFLPTLLALYSQMYDEQKVFGIITLSVISFLALILLYV